ncbi:ATP-binding protein [Streptomyces sp. JJ36]|uniref:ATP-binding protein n=1 Tax=Streptomyces sp. JJ36 TaxID=2736645 RepID=UPI001F1F2A87|nr:ATP-binding protein [Streptomyces sp. JJ36]MCF6522112.1 ATP-binding protein [Streptomyces sp. JJ36]
MALVVAQEVPASSTMAVPHGPAGVGAARRRMREDLRACGAAETVVDDAVLVLSELLSNACRHARPLGPAATGAYVRADWSRDVSGELTISVTDGGGPTRPVPATPSVSARGGRGLSIITSLARAWGVEECASAPGQGAQVSGARARTGTAPHGMARPVPGRDTPGPAPGRGSPGYGAAGGADGAATGVRVWAVLAPAEDGGYGDAFAGLGLAELEELDDGLDELDRA